jgi:hypothetical protein
MFVVVYSRRTEIFIPEKVKKPVTEKNNQSGKLPFLSKPSLVPKRRLLRYARNDESFSSHGGR